MALQTALPVSAFGFNPYRDNYHREPSYRDSYPFSLAHHPSISPISPLSSFSDYSPRFTDYHYQSHSMSHQEQNMPSSQQSMQGSGSSHMPIDPSLNIQYPPYYGNFSSQSQHQHHQQQPPSHLLAQHLSLPPNYSSPSSGASDTIGTPPVEHMYPASSSSGLTKRPASSISNATASTSRKKVRMDDEDGDGQSPSADKEEKPKPTRGSRACTVCRRLKMKCVGAEEGPPCKRCITGNHECIFEESNRGKRSAKKHEALTRSVRKMEKTLDTVLKAMGNPDIASGLLSRTPSPSPREATTQALLAASPSPPPPPSFPTHSHSHPSRVHHPPSSPKLHSLPDNALNPLGLLAEASLANRRSQQSNARGSGANNVRNDNPQVGVASDNYFKPGPMTILPLRRLYIERQIQPEMLSFVSTDEVVALFKIYFEHIHMHCVILDPNFHTPSLVCSRSPFLLTTICSIASKFYTAKPELHPRLTELAKKLAFSVPAKGYKSVEIVQAYLLLALWGCGAVERYEQDKTWLLLGMAIRMGTDLNLHRKTATASLDTPEGRARDIEVHNRERTWILCFALDRSFSAQMGKPNTIKEDYIIRHADQWYQSPVAMPSDASLVGYAELQRILSRSIDFLYSGTDSVNGLQTNCDYLLVIKTFEAQLHNWQSRWAHEIAFKGETAPILEYKRMISEFYFNYAMLVLNSFGLQNALERAPINIPHFFARCHTSAMSCAMIVRDRLGPSGYIRYSPDSHFVQISYAVLSLLKLIRPEFQAFLNDEQKTLQLVKDVADVLDDIAANPLHTPALYSGFLRALISAKLEPSTNGLSDGGSLDSHKPDDHKMGDMNHNHLDMHGHGYSQHSGRGQQPSSSNHHSESVNGDGTGFNMMNEFQFDGEMGPVADMSTFPPTMAPPPNVEDTSATGLTMENFLGSGFWDSMLVPGYNSLDGFSGGFVFGAGGSGLITPRFGMSPLQSGNNTPGRHAFHHQQLTNQLTQHSINAAFKNKQLEGSSGLKIDTLATAAS